MRSSTIFSVLLVGWICSMCYADERLERRVGTKTGLGDKNLHILPNIMQEIDVAKVAEFVDNGGLGPDPVSVNFLEREKNIRFIMTLGKSYVLLEQDYFIQPSDFNGANGGFRRYFKLVPEELLRGPLNGVIMHFLDHHNFPDKCVILVQLQSTILHGGDDYGDVTGQGIHRDGNEDSMLLNIQRDHVSGGENQFFADLEGTVPVGPKLILKPGDGVFFRDNKIYHHAHNARADGEKGRRTMLILAAPAEFALIGVATYNSQALVSDVQLENEFLTSSTYATGNKNEL